MATKRYVVVLHRYHRPAVDGEKSEIKSRGQAEDHSKQSESDMNHASNIDDTDNAQDPKREK